MQQVVNTLLQMEVQLKQLLCCQRMLEPLMLFLSKVAVYSPTNQMSMCDTVEVCVPEGYLNPYVV